MSLILILLGFLLIFLNIRFINDKNQTNKKTEVVDEENSFTSVLKNEELDITAVDVIVGKLRMEFSETILELQKEIMELSTRIEELSESMDVDVEKFDDTALVNENKIILDNLNKEKIINNRMDEIGEMLKKGFSVEDISEKFQIGRGEILLIEKLYRK